MGKRSLRLYVLAAVCPIALLLVMAALFFRPILQVDPVAQPVPQLERASAQEPIEAVEPSAYTIGIWQGRVAVFEACDDTPFTVLDTPVNTLPAADQTALAQGIPVSDRETLAGLLEDYGS